MQYGPPEPKSKEAEKPADQEAELPVDQEAESVDRFTRFP